MSFENKSLNFCLVFISLSIMVSRQEENKVIRLLKTPWVGVGLEGRRVRAPSELGPGSLASLTLSYKQSFSQ